MWHCLLLQSYRPQTSAWKGLVPLAIYSTESSAVIGWTRNANLVMVVAGPRVCFTDPGGLGKGPQKFTPTRFLNAK